MAERARIAFRDGHSAIVDAVYGRPGDRQAIERVAVDVAVPLVPASGSKHRKPTFVARAWGSVAMTCRMRCPGHRLQHRDGTGVMGWHPFRSLSATRRCA